MYVSGSSIEQSYNKFKGLDFNKDNKISGNEIQFANFLNKIKENPSAENIKKADDLIAKVDKNSGKQYALKQDLLLTIMSAKCSDPPKASELNDILKILPGNNKTDWADKISSLTYETKEDNSGPNADDILEFQLPDDISNYTKFDTKKGEFSALPDKTIPSFKEKYQVLENSALSVTKDILDGDTNISGVDKNITENFLGKKDASINTYQAGTFDPNKFVSFDIKLRKHTIKNGDQVMTIDRSVNQTTKSNYTDPKTGKVSSVNASDLRNKLVENYPEFKKFAEDNKLFNDKGELDNSKLKTVKNFVATLPDTDKKMNFVTNFMSAYFVHSGEGAGQKNINEDNFTEVLASPDMLRSDDGRSVLDCQYFAAVGQNLLGVEKGKNGSLEAKDVVISTFNDKKKEDGLHQVTLLKDSANGKFYIQSNDQIKEISKDQLEKSGWNEKKGSPTDAQLIKAANYTPKKEGEKGLLAEQFSNGTAFFNYSIKDDPLSNQLPKGHTKLSDFPEGGIKSKDSKGKVYLSTFEGKSLPEKSGELKLPDGSQGTITLTTAGNDYFKGKFKDKSGQEQDIKIFWDSEGKIQVEKK